MDNDTSFGLGTAHLYRLTGISRLSISAANNIDAHVNVLGNVSNRMSRKTKRPLSYKHRAGKNNKSADSPEIRSPCFGMGTEDLILCSLPVGYTLGFAPHPRPPCTGTIPVALVTCVVVYLM